MEGLVDAETLCWRGLLMERPIQEKANRTYPFISLSVNKYLSR